MKTPIEKARGDDLLQPQLPIGAQGAHVMHLVVTRDPVTRVALTAPGDGPERDCGVRCDAEVWWVQGPDSSGGVGGGGSPTSVRWSEMAAPRHPETRVSVH